MIVDIFEDDSVSRRQLVAKTRLLVDNKPAPGEEHVQFYHVSETWVIYPGLLSRITLIAGYHD